MSSAPQISVSRQACRRMTRHHAKTFYFASHVLPREKRSDAYSVYAFCRYVDDEVDLAPDDTARFAAFGRLQGILDLAYAKTVASDSTPGRLPWFPAFQNTVHRRQIPQNYFQDLLAGVQMDCGRVRLHAWADLERYCYHVASVVGLIMVHVLSEPAPELLAPAQHLGTAMQLTNILRDIREDWERDRVYLPQAEMEKFGLSDEDIALQRMGEPFRAFMRFQIGRARSYYSLAQRGIDALPHDGSRLTVRLMRRIYGAILDEIERADYQVFRKRVHVAFARKLWLAVTV